MQGAGKGLFASKDFKKGEKIADYTGDLVRLGAEDGKQSPSGYRSNYILELTEVIGIDAARTNTAVGRMVNDARGSGLRNNVRFSCNQREKTAKLIAVRNIKKGEEFLVSYGRNFWPKQVKVNQQSSPVTKAAEPIEAEAAEQSGIKQQPILVSVIQTIAAALNAVQQAVQQLKLVPHMDKGGLHKEGRMQQSIELLCSSYI